MKPTITELIQCATREAGLRRTVYPNAKLSPEVKERELTRIDAIVKLLAKVSELPATLELLASAGIIQHQPELL